MSAVAPTQAVDFITQLPPELSLFVLGNLGPVALSRCAVLCRRWRELASDRALWQRFDLTILFPKIRFFEANLGLDNRRVIPLLVRCSKTPVEGDKGFSVLRVPKDTTLDFLKKKMGNAAPTLLYNAGIREFCGGITTKETQVVAISNSVLQGSRGVVNVERLSLALGELGFEVAGVLQITTLVVETYRVFQERLLPPGTFSHCLEQVGGNHLFIGGFADRGPIIDSYALGTANRGAVAVVELPVEQP